MRTIKFRGERIDNGQWVYGLPLQHEYGWSMTNKDSLYHVDGAEYNFFDIRIGPETVEQFTGLTDKNGNDIYENDILDDGKFKYRVYGLPGGFGIKAPAWCDDMSELQASDYLIIQSLSEPQTASYVSNSCEITH